MLYTIIGSRWGGVRLQWKDWLKIDQIFVIGLISGRGWTIKTTPSYGPEHACFYEQINDDDMLHHSFDAPSSSQVG